MNNFVASIKPRIELLRLALAQQASVTHTTKSQRRLYAAQRDFMHLEDTLDALLKKLAVMNDTTVAFQRKDAQIEKVAVKEVLEALRGQGCEGEDGG